MVLRICTPWLPSLSFSLLFLSFFSLSLLSLPTPSCAESPSQNPFAYIQNMPLLEAIEKEEIIERTEAQIREIIKNGGHPENGENPEIPADVPETPEESAEERTGREEKEGEEENMSNDNVLLWPLPKSYTKGDGKIRVSRSLEWRFHGPARNSDILLEASERTKALIFTHPKPSVEKAHEKSLSMVVIRVHSADESLQLETDESYSLEIPSNGSAAVISAPTVYGALYALQTLSQLCRYDWEEREVFVTEAPWTVEDAPRFQYRGLLIDTARHFQPIPILKRIIDSMAYAKLNVFHWHIVDEQSFSIEIPSFPKLWEGSFRVEERYTMDDAKDLVKYAQFRGIKVMPEIDIPGHAQSWGVGYPELWPSPSCRMPLDVSKPFTFELIDGILKDFESVFPFRLIHLGGDEVNTDCWVSTPHVRNWLDLNNFTPREAYADFVLRGQRLALDRGRTPVHWEETFNIFGDRLDNRTIVHNWLGPGVAPRVTHSGLNVIVSDNGPWYLDHMDATWQRAYAYEPTMGVTSADDISRVLGGEACMWGETADAGNVLMTIWPRAGAMAERLWSPLAKLRGGPSSTVLERYEWFRCLLHRRGISAGTIHNSLARDSPQDPGSCYDQ